MGSFKRLIKLFSASSKGVCTMFKRSVDSAHYAWAPRHSYDVASLFKHTGASLAVVVHGCINRLILSV